MKKFANFIFSIQGKLLWIATGLLCILMSSIAVFAFLGVPIPKVEIISPWRELYFLGMILSIIYFGTCALIYLVSFINAVGEANESN